jgi:two-component system, NarL family, sensor histidine kinase DesK
MSSSSTTLSKRRGMGWTKYVWLAYLVFYFAPLFFGPATTRQWVLSLLAVAVFVPLYLCLFRVHGGWRLSIALATYALGALMVPINPGANCFFIYGMAFVPFSAPSRIALRWVLAMVAGLALQAYAFQWTVAFWVPTLLVSTVVGITNLSLAERRFYVEQLSTAQEAIERMARIAERERIGRDLHDLLGHTLSVIVLKSELATKLFERDPARSHAEVRDVERIAREALVEVRKAVRGYRCAGLADELANAERVLISAGIEPVLQNDRPQLSEPQERALAYALREAVTNVVRHAQARHCWISIAARSGQAVLEVRDDGRGGETREGSGLQGMRERLREVSGTLERDGHRGTCLRMTLPLGSASPALEATP